MKALFPAMLGALLLAGCSVARVNESMDKVERDVSEADELVQGMKVGRGSEDPSVVFTDEPWVSFDPVPPDLGIPDEKDCNVTWNRSAGVMEFAQILTRMCDIRVRVTPDVISRKGRVDNDDDSEGDAQSDTVGLFPGTSSGGSGRETNREDNYISGIRFEGRLSRLLDLVTAQLGLSWEYTSSGKINIFYMTTRTYPFYAFASDTEMTSVVQSGTTSEAGSGNSVGGGTDGGISGFSGSSQSTSVKMETSVIQDIEETVQALLSDDGYMSLSGSTGIITVTDRVDVLDRVGTYLAEQNESLTTQVLLNVKVFSVTLNDSDSLGIDWDIVYESAGEEWNFGLNNASGVNSNGVVSGQVGILDGKFAGTTAVINALSKQGKVSVVTSPSVTTLNLQPVPVQVARQTGYLARSEVTNTADVGSTMSYIPGTVTSGFNMNLLPFVMNKKELLLKYSINISSLVQLRSLGDGTIEVPEIDNRIFSQNVRLRSGETLVLSGFDQKSESGDKAGVGDASNWLFGGSAERESKRDVIVVMITPEIKGSR